MMLPLALASCGDDEPYNEPYNTTKDPDGTVVLNLMNNSSVQLPYAGGENGYYNTITAIGSSIGSYNLRPGFGEIAMIGPVKGISNITMKSIPSTGWTSVLAAQVGCGYVIRYYNSWYDHCYMYWAVYVDSELIDTSGGVIGYVIKVLPFN